MRLPLNIVTASQRKRKSALDARLQELQDAIHIFSRAKVYIAKDT